MCRVKATAYIQANSTDCCWDARYTSVSCPTNYAYTISGTNAGGVVVTIDRSAVVLPEPEGSGTDTTADTSAGTTADTAAGS